MNKSGFLGIWLVASFLIASYLSGYNVFTALPGAVYSGDNEWHVDACAKDDRIGDDVFHYNKNTKDILINGKAMRPNDIIDNVQLIRQSDCEADIKMIGQKFSVFESNIGVSELNNWLEGIKSGAPDISLTNPKLYFQNYGSGTFFGGGGSENTVTVTSSQLNSPGLELTWEPMFSGDSYDLQKEDVLNTWPAVSCDLQFKVGARYSGGSNIFEKYIRNDNGGTWIDELWWSRIPSKNTEGKLGLNTYTTTGSPYDFYAEKIYRCSGVLQTTKYARATTYTYLTVINDPVSTPAPTSVPVVTTSPVVTSSPTLPPAQPISTNCEPTITGTSIDGVSSSTSFSVSRVQGVGATVGVKYTSSCALIMVGFSSINNGMEIMSGLSVPPSAAGGFYTQTLYSEALRVGTNKIMAYWYYNGQDYKKQIGTIQVSSSSPIGGQPGSSISDSDGDGIMDSDDNCINIRNGGQTDSDGDGIGDVCDSTPTGSSGNGGRNGGIKIINDDYDNDGILDGEDNCASISNSDQKDVDNDGLGDVCDINKDNKDDFNICPKLSFDLDEIAPAGKIWKLEYNKEKTCVLTRSLIDAPKFDGNTSKVLFYKMFVGFSVVGFGFALLLKR